MMWCSIFFILFYYYYLLLLDDEAVAFFSKELETFQPLRFHPSIYAAIVDQHKNNESPWQSTELNDTETPRYTKSFGVEEHRFVVAQDSSVPNRAVWSKKADA